MAAGSGLGLVKYVSPPMGPRILPVTIAPPSASAATAAFSLGDNEKRWLVVGICLNKLILPALRKFVSQEMQRHYNILKKKHNINIQTYGTQLKKDARQHLNYGSINNNFTSYKKNSHLYNYTVTSDIELGKLYLEPHMAHYTGYDDTCDLSAVLGIIVNASIFSSAVQNSARDVRAKVRNDWGHCNFVDWDTAKFAFCFQLMETLVRSVGLKSKDERILLSELTDWEKRGLILCLGHPVDAALMKLVRNEVCSLINDVDTLSKTNEEEAKRVKDELQNVKDEIGKFDNRMTELECKVEQFKKKVSRDLQDLEKKQEKTSLRVDGFERSYEKIQDRINDLESLTQKSQKVFKFQAPDRNLFFCGRSKEMETLKAHALTKLNSNGCITSAICGLGGTGKTSLAVEYVWRMKQDFPGGVLWLSGESRSLFQITLSDLARQIGTLELEFSQTLSKTLYWLQSSDDRWCVVLDNFDEREISREMRQFIQGHWKREARGHLIVTTRREPKDMTDIGIEEEGCIELKSMTTEEGITFIKVRSGNNDESQDAVISGIVQELGGLPLALEQAVAYVNYLHCSFAKYLQQYKEQKLKLLNRRKARFPTENTSPERVAVFTTWSLNFEYISELSEEYGVGQAASIVMEISAFLSPDDIPSEIINEGYPETEIPGLKESVETDLGPTEILSILTKFSLFQQNNADSYSVHRLVQEVIRTRTEKDRVPKVFQSAIRMLRYSFEKTNSPFSVCNRFVGDAVFSVENLPSLNLWGRLAAHACVLLDHLLEYDRNKTGIFRPVIFSNETAKLLDEATIYLSACREKVKALELKKRRLEVLMNTESPQKDKAAQITESLDIPLKELEFKLISRCMKEKEIDVPEEEEEEEEKEEEVPFSCCLEKSEKLRTDGNQAVGRESYAEALSLYTQAIHYTPDNHRLYANRALCHLKLGQAELALENCEKCLKISHLNDKALARKAWALHDLAKDKAEELEGRAFAAAALAVHVNCSNWQVLRTMFPGLSYKVISKSHELVQSFSSRSQITLLLEEGEYSVDRTYLSPNTHFVGLGAGATIRCSNIIPVVSRYYFENITFPEGNGPVVCYESGVVSLYNCKISGGQQACKDFPECNGGMGCVAESRGKPHCSRVNKYGIDCPSGLVGSAGLQVMGTGFVNKCKVLNCGGGGALSVGEKAKLHICESVIHGNIQSGLEAREGGCLVATNNKIYSNGLHGILVGPNASSCLFRKNKIFENEKEGVMVCSTTQEITFEENDVYYNKAFGFSLDNSKLTISRNRIFENGFYGVIAKSRTTVVLKHNELFANKCGGIFIGVNYSGNVLIESNTIRDHCGPPYLFQDEQLSSKHSRRLTEEKLKQYYLQRPVGETTVYSKPPIFYNNKVINKKEGLFHPKEVVNNLSQDECSFCHSKELACEKCSRCRFVSYCSKDCQNKHWCTHKPLCSAISSRYYVTVTRIYVPELEGYSTKKVRAFGSHLKGIGKGPKPNPSSNKNFIVKVQTRHLNCHPLQLLGVYDRSLYVDCFIRSPEVFRIIMECGVLGEQSKYTSKKAFFWATFTNDGKDMKICLCELAPYQEW